MRKLQIVWASEVDIDRAAAEARNRTQWGRWTLNKENPWSLDIQPYAHNNFPYQIVLFKRDCDFSKFTEWLGNWVQHIQRKTWLSHEDLWQFVEAAQNIRMYRGK